MTENRLPYRLHLLMLRLWQEVIDGEQWEWRGEIRNINTGELRYFRDFQTLIQLLPLLLSQPNTHEAAEQQSSNELSYSLQERIMTATTQPLEAGVQATNRSFEAAFTRRDAAAAAAVYTTGAEAFPPNGAIVAGRSALQRFWQSVMDMGVKNVTLETMELVPCGEIAYEVGKATLYGEGGTVLDIAKFIVIWQQEDGQWKWHRDIWNSNNPA